MGNPIHSILSALRSEITARGGDAETVVRGEIKTIDEYRSRLWRAAVRLFNSGKDANFLGSFARSIDQQLTEAWNQGADDVGVAPEDMNPDDMTVLEGIINNENDYLDGIAGDIAADRDAGMSREDFDSKYGTRIDIWAGRYTEVVNTSRIRFGGKQRLVWKLGETEKHCPECAQLDGIVAWATEWEQADIHPQNPPNPHISCGGWLCDCSLEPTDARRTARAFDRLTEIALQGNV